MLTAACVCMLRNQLMPEYLIALVCVGLVVFVTLFVGSFFTLALCTGVIRLLVRIYQTILIGQSRERRRQIHRRHTATANWFVE